MNKPYVIKVNNVLWDRKVTFKGALKVAEELKDKGLNAAVAYEIEREII